MAEQRRCLVIGLSGQVGEVLRPQLPALGEIWGLSRQQQRDEPGIHWLAGLLQAMPPLPEHLDTILSLGPLDAFADWFAQSGLADVRIVALGSTGHEDKRDSADPEEQGVAWALSAAESRLFAAGRRQNATITVLRPTLTYGHGRDASLSSMLAMAQRWGWVVLPAGAVGLRQPVHVDDVADAVLACLETPASVGRTFDLPGGERLGFRAMVERSLARHAPQARVAIVPRWLFRIALATAAGFGMRPVGPGFVERTRRDQVADPEPARTVFGFQPRVFDP